MEKKLLLIYNPVSGKAQIKTYLADIIDIYSGKNYEVTVHPTKCKLDGFNYIKENAHKYDVLSVCGGDGMLNEAVCALMHIDGKVRPALAYLPSGSTNDFAGTVGIPLDIIEAAKMVVSGSPFFCDAGKMNDNYFAYIAAFGAFTSVAYDTAQEFKNVFGHLAYILEGIRQLPTIKPLRIRAKFEDNVIEDEFMFGMVTNALQVAGIKHNMGTAISLNDGLFEVFLIKRPQTATGYQNLITAFLTQDLEKTDDIISFKTSKITFESDEPIPWTLDGEFGGEVTTANIETLPRAFSVIV